MIKPVKTRAFKLIVFAIWVANLLLLLAPRASNASGNFRYDTKVNYRIEADGTTHVVQNYTITNLTPLFYLTEIKLTTPSSNISDLKASYNDGSAIPVTSTKQPGSKGDIKFEYQQIQINFPRQLYGSGRSWSFSVNYVTSGLVDSKGGSHTVYLPSVESATGDDYQATVDVPASFGTPHFSGASANSGGTSPGRQFYDFSKSDLTQHSLALAFGDANLYQLNFNFPLHNPSPFSRTLTVTLPPDLNNQKVYLNSLKPQPIATRLDNDGNVLADYHLAPHQDLTVQTDITGEVHYLEYALSQSKKRSDIPADLVAKYTLPTAFWPTTGDVQQAAQKLTNANAPVIDNVHAMYQFVIDKLSYNPDKIKFNVRLGAAKALASPSNAVCLEYSDLLIAMLRSQGIPARMVVGYGYSGSLKNSSAVTDSLHAWVEAYVPGIGWMTLDPTWGEKFDQFGKSDLDHMAFAVWGDSDQSPDAVMASSIDQNYQYENTSLSYARVITKAPPVAKLSAHRLALLPFLAIDIIDAQAPPQVASDNNQVNLAGTSLQLGSLAPNQSTRLYHLSIGHNWSKPIQANFVRSANNQALLLATTTSKPNYTPLIIMIVLAIMTATLIMVKLRPHINQIQGPAISN